MQSFFSSLSINSFYYWGFIIIGIIIFAIGLGAKLEKITAWLKTKPAFYIIGPISLITAIGNAIPIIIVIIAKNVDQEKVKAILAIRNEFGGFLFLLGIIVLWAYFIEMIDAAKLSPEKPALMGMQVICLLFVLDYIQCIMGNLKILFNESILKVAALIPILIIILLCFAILSKKVNKALLSETDEVVTSSIFLYSFFIGFLEPSIILASSLLYLVKRILSLTWPQGMQKIKRKDIFSRSFSISTSLLASFMGYLVLFKVFMLPFLDLNASLSFELSLFVLSIVVLALYSFEFSPILIVLLGVPCCIYFIILTPLKNGIIKGSYLELVHLITGSTISNFSFFGLPIIILFIAPILLHLYIICNIFMRDVSFKPVGAFLSAAIMASLWPHVYFLLLGMLYHHTSSYKLIAVLFSTILMGVILFFHVKLNRNIYA